MNRARKKKVQEIANFIVNNITLAEVTTIAIKQAQEYAEFMVKYNLDPNNFNSEIARKKLFKKIQLEKEKAEIERQQAKGPVVKFEGNRIVKEVEDDTTAWRKFLKFLGLIKKEKTKVESKKLKTKGK